MSKRITVYEKFFSHNLKSLQNIFFSIFYYFYWIISIHFFRLYISSENLNVKKSNFKSVVIITIVIFTSYLHRP